MLNHGNTNSMSSSTPPASTTRARMIRSHSGPGSTSLKNHAYICLDTSGVEHIADGLMVVQLGGHLAAQWCEVCDLCVMNQPLCVGEHRVAGRQRQDAGFGGDARLTGHRGQHLGLVRGHHRSEEHTSELQSRFDLVCRLLLEKKKNCTTTDD